MNFLILGDGREELAWARAVAAHPGHRVRAAYPGFEAFPDLDTHPDLDDALAAAGVEAAVVGGEPDLRAEALRRVAAAGLPAICLHPPGSGADPYYAVALSRAETGAIVVPDLPDRLHPGVAAIKSAWDSGEFGPARTLRLEATVPAGDDLVGRALPRHVDLVRAILGEVESVLATGDPPGTRPADALLVQLRGPASRRAELRLGPGPSAAARLSVLGPAGSVVLEFEPSSGSDPSPSRLIRRGAPGREAASEVAAWDGRAALLDVLDAAAAAGPGGPEPRPGLLDGTRTLELADAVTRSLKRGRTIDLHYEEISEAGTFKTVMTSLGCLILFGALVALPAALVGPAFGIPQTIYIAYLIPPLLVGFLVLQGLKLAVGRGVPPPRPAPRAPAEDLEAALDR